METEPPKNSPRISVFDFVENSFDELKLIVVAGEKGLKKRFISSARIQKLGLALAGFAHYIHEGRIQIVGKSEIGYLQQLDSSKRYQAVKNLDLQKVCCILVTKNQEPPEELKRIADEEQLPIIQTQDVSSLAINRVSKYLQIVLAPHTTLHGVLMGMYGIGVLMLGESGIGKSECALDLISRGHRLISDDTVLVKKIGDKLEGGSPDLTREHLEIRGLGIINIRDLFGVSSISKNKQIELLIELKKWNEMVEIERLGLETHVEDILGVKLNKIILPVSVGRNLTTLVETAVRVYLLRMSGMNAAETLTEKQRELIRKKSADGA
ncbi:MAG: HPr(Ser) kinase/phosphatase [Pyrinomonadaceae bacterium]